MPRIISRTVLVLSALLASVAGTATQAAAAGPFTCRPGFYQVISGQLKILNPLTGVYTDIGADGDDYNAIGYNPNDNYIYGWGTAGANSGQLIRIDSAGTVTALGNAGITSGSYVSGDFDDNNNLYFRKNNTTLVKVNVAANPPTSMELTMTGSIFGGVDMGWINGVMYAVNDSTLYRVNLSTLVASSATVADLGSPSGKEFPNSGTYAYGAIFSDREDELYASNNSLGRIYRVTDFTGPNPKATWVTDATVTSNNDGAACKLASSPFVLPTATNDTYSTSNDTTLSVSAGSGILNNDSAATPVVLSSSNPASGTLTMNADGSFTYRPAAGFVGAVTFTYVAQDKWGQNATSATVTINVTAGATTTTAAAATTTTAVSTAASVPATVDDGPQEEPGLPTSGTSPGPLYLGLSSLLSGLAIVLARRRSRPRQVS